LNKYTIIEKQSQAVFDGMGAACGASPGSGAAIISVAFYVF